MSIVTIVSIIAALSIYFLLMDWSNKPENIQEILEIFKKYGCENGVSKNRGLKHRIIKIIIK